jgi:anti-sigma regulatory factor (Ser/Thr protein kinase)
MTFSDLSGGAGTVRPVVISGTTGPCPAFHQDSWPRSSFTGLAALPASVAEFRHYTRRILSRWGAGPVTDTAILVVSELATNAVKASAGSLSAGTPRVWLRLAGSSRRILIRVRDGDGRMPVLRDSGPEALSGRGLPLVGMLAEQWGWYPCGTGKAVWAVICIPGRGDP